MGDPHLLIDKIQYCAESMVDSNFLVNQNDEVYTREKGDLITTNITSAYEWFQLSLTVLIQKNIGMVDPPFWTGLWKDVQHKFLPGQIIKNNKCNNGWIEISIDKVAEKLIVPSSAISLLPEKDMLASY